MERNTYSYQGFSILANESEPKILFAASLVSLSLINDLREVRPTLNVGKKRRASCIFTGRCQGFLKSFNLSRIVVRSSFHLLNGFRKS